MTPETTALLERLIGVATRAEASAVFYESVAGHNVYVEALCGAVRDRAREVREIAEALTQQPKEGEK
jgi:hypothetical protein